MTEYMTEYTDYNILYQEALKPIENHSEIKKEVHYPDDLSKLIIQKKDISYKDGGIRYIDPKNKIVYVFNKFKGTIKEENMTNEERIRFFGSSYIIDNIDNIDNIDENKNKHTLTKFYESLFN
jgi:hypothetical protein